MGRYKSVNKETKPSALFFSFTSAELASAGTECRVLVSDPLRDPLVHVRP